MLKSTAIAASLFIAAASQTIAASTPSMPSSTCDDASMKALETKINAMADGTQKQTATEELSMAKLSVKADKRKDCSMHLDNAMKATGAAM